MKHLIVLLLILVCYFEIKAQVNLVPNGRFEEVNRPDTCMVDNLPFLDTDIYHPYHQVKYWVSPLLFPTYYCNACDTSNSWSVPTNALGYQEDADSGHAYAGLITLNWLDTLSYSVIQVQLTEQLRKDSHYVFKMKVSPGDIYFYRSTIGICFEKDSSTDILGINHTPTYPEYTYTTDSVIKNCTVWTEVVFNIYPHMDSLKYLLISSFPSIAPIKFSRIDSTDPSYATAYDSQGVISYVDDVRLFLVSKQDGIEEFATQKVNIHISPNPAQNKIQVQTDKFESSYTWSLYDISGRLIQQYLISRKEQEIELPVDLNSGMYLWKGERDGVLLNCGKLLKE
jgi:hypothetical protein